MHQSSDLTKNIIAPLAFFGIFGKALQVEEIEMHTCHTFSHSPKHIAKLSQHDLLRSIHQLHTQGTIKAKGMKGRVAYALAGVTIENRSAHSAVLLQKAHQWRWIFKVIPFIRSVYVCNTISFDAAKPGSDIDLFIVTKAHRLFTARFLLTLLTHILGIRRHGKKVECRLCLSFFMDEAAPPLSNLALREDIYFIYWLKCLIPLYMQTQADTRWIDESENWLSQFLYHPTLNKIAPDKDRWVKKISEWILSGIAGNMLEFILKTIQLHRARKKAAHLKDHTGTVMNEHILKFHDVDRRNEIQKQWEKVYAQIIKQRAF